MNERIRELAEQAYEQKPLMVLNPETFEIEHKIGNGGVAMYHRVFNQEKFAELIIKECGVALNPPVQVRNVISRGQAYNLIRQHFGVSE
jgi:hypothetical protein